MDKEQIKQTLQIAAYSNRSLFIIGLMSTLSNLSGLTLQFSIIGILLFFIELFIVDRIVDNYDKNWSVFITILSFSSFMCILISLILFLIK